MRSNRGILQDLTKEKNLQVNCSNHYNQVITVFYQLLEWQEMLYESTAGSDNMIYI